MGDQLAGPTVDALGVTFNVDPDQQVVAVVAIGKVVAWADGRTSLVLGHSGLDWIEQRGLLAAALHVLDSAPVEDG